MERRIRSIVIGIADVVEERPYLAHAIELAEGLEAELHVVHAFHLPEPVMYPHAEAFAADLGTVEQLERQALGRLEGEVGRMAVGERIRCRVLPAPADRAVLDVAEEVGADLVLVGATRHGALARAILGTTAQRVLRASRAPVLVLRPRQEARTLRRVLLTSDLSALSERVHERAVEMLGMLGARDDLELRSLVVLAYDLPLPPPLQQSVLREVAEDQLRKFLDRIDGGGATVEGRVRIGEPPNEIVAEAKEWGADLLVLGTHGRTGTSRLLIGSVAEAVLRSAGCDVLALPPTALTPSDRSGTASAEAASPPIEPMHPAEG